jgi:DNA replication protein DnaD
MSKTPIKRFSKLTALQEQVSEEQKETVVNQTSEQNPEQTNQPEVNQTIQNISTSFDVLKTDLSKDDPDISGQYANTPIYSELNMVIDQISKNIKMPYYKLVNNILYDWLMNNKETIARAKKMSKEKNALAKKFL